MSAKRIKLLQRGDTIVEVLIAIAVASSVLAISYSTMNRNLLLTRDAQERTEATKIAQGQIELFKAYRDAGSTYSGTFCLSASSSAPVTTFRGGSPSASLPDTFSNYPVACSNSFYHFAIVAETGSDIGTYRFYVRWDKVSGSGQDQVIMAYRR